MKKHGVHIPHEQTCSRWTSAGFNTTIRAKSRKKQWEVCHQKLGLKVLAYFSWWLLVSLSSFWAPLSGRYEVGSNFTTDFGNRMSLKCGRYPLPPIYGIFTGKLIIKLLGGMKYLAFKTNCFSG